MSDKDDKIQMLIEENELIDDNERWKRTSAHLMAIQKILARSGIASDEEYHKNYLRSLAEIDQGVAERLEKRSNASEEISNLLQQKSDEMKNDS